MIDHGLVVGFVGGAIAKAGITFTSFSNSEEVLVSSGFLGALLAGFLGGFVVLFLKKNISFYAKKLRRDSNHFNLSSSRNSINRNHNVIN